MYSKIAEKEGFPQIAEIFLVTADNELEHAKWIFRMINNLKEKGNVPDEIKVDSGAPTTLADTATNLKAAIAGENHEHTSMYPEFADTAEKEGLEDVANRLRAIARAEVHHESRYLSLLKEVEEATVFKKSQPVAWVCRKCGYVHEGIEPPKKCPSCDHETKYFERKCEQY